MQHSRDMFLMCCCYSIAKTDNERCVSVSLTMPCYSLFTPPTWRDKTVLSRLPLCSHCRQDSFVLSRPSFNESAMAAWTQLETWQNCLVLSSWWCQHNCRQDKTVLSCLCRWCEQAITDPINMLLAMLSRCPRYFSHGPAGLMWSVVHLPFTWHTHITHTSIAQLCLLHCVSWKSPSLSTNTVYLLHLINCFLISLVHSTTGSTTARRILYPTM